MGPTSRWLAANGSSEFGGLSVHGPCRQTPRSVTGHLSYMADNSTATSGTANSRASDEEIEELAAAASEALEAWRQSEDRHAWAKQAACRGMNPNLFYLDKGNDFGGYCPEVRATCGGCAVRFTCLAVAIVNRERHGLWGGVPFKDRQRVCRKINETARQAAVGQGAA